MNNAASDKAVPSSIEDNANFLFDFHQGNFESFSIRLPRQWSRFRNELFLLIILLSLDDFLLTSVMYWLDDGSSKKRPWYQLSVGRSVLNGLLPQGIVKKNMITFITRIWKGNGSMDNILSYLAFLFSRILGVLLLSQDFTFLLSLILF